MVSSLSRNPSANDPAAVSTSNPISALCEAAVCINALGGACFSSSARGRLPLWSVDRLRQSIMCGDLGFGEQLSEGALARQLGVSKTPVREALQQLRNEGLVRIVPHTGTFVFTLSAREVKELCELRVTLERAALRFAVERNRGRCSRRYAPSPRAWTMPTARGDIRRYLELDTAYHAEFFANCGNSYITQAYDTSSAGSPPCARTSPRDRAIRSCRWPSTTL